MTLTVALAACQVEVARHGSAEEGDGEGLSEGVPGEGVDGFEDAPGEGAEIGAGEGGAEVPGDGEVGEAGLFEGGSESPAEGHGEGVSEGEAQGEGEGEGEGEGGLEGEGEGPDEGGVEGPAEGEGGEGGEGGEEGEEGEGEGDLEPPPAVAAIRLTPASLTLAPVALGATSAVGTFTIASVGEAALTNLRIELDGAGFAMQADCPQDETLAAGAACLVHVSYTPDAAGPAVALVIASHSGGASATGVVRASGLPLGPAVIRYVGDEAGLAFGEVSDPAVREAAFFNAGESASAELLAVVEGPGFGIVEDGCSFQRLGPAQGCTVAVRFGPPVNGEFDGELLLWGGAPLRVALSGSGVDVAEAALTLDTQLLDFGAAGPDGSVVRRVRVGNAGARPLERLRVRLERDEAFALHEDGTCVPGQNLDGGAGCVVAVAFTPVGEGLARGRLWVGAAGTDDLDVALLGLGDGFDPPRLASGLPGEFLAFGDVEDAAERVVTISNVGDATTGALFVRLGGDGFGLGDPGEAARPLCPGLLLAPGQQCDVPLRFAPERDGLHEGALLVADGGVELTVTLTGRGVGHEPAVLSTDPPVLDFAAVDSGRVTEALTVELRNTGDLAAEGLQIALEGLHAGDFELDLDGGAVGCPDRGDDLPGGDSCSVAIAFRPRAEGERVAELVIRADGVAPAVTALTGTGRGFAPALLAWRAAPDPDFGDVHEVEPRDFWAQNLGGRNSGQLSIRLTGDPSFRIDPGDDDCGGRTLASFAECAVTVTFVTADNGEYSARLEVSDRDGSDVVELAARSVGWLPAELQSDPEALAFGDLGELLRSEALTATVTNIGELPVPNISVTLEAAAEVFELLDQPPGFDPNDDPPPCEAGTDLLGGQSCTVTAVLAPPDEVDVGSWSGTVTVGSGDHVVDVRLTGRRGIASNCQEILEGDPDAEDGVYAIDPDEDGAGQPFDIYCLMSIAGGGWMVSGYIKAIGQWPWNVYEDSGEVGAVGAGFNRGGALRDNGVRLTEKVIVYKHLIENGNDLGTQWMALRRTDGAAIAYSQVHSTGQGWTYTDSRGAGPVNAGNVCSHNCNSYAGHGMFHDSSNIGYHGTQSGNYGCRDGNNICWKTHGDGCNVGSRRCSNLTGEDEGVIYGVR